MNLPDFQVICYNQINGYWLRFNNLDLYLTQKPREAFINFCLSFVVFDLTIPDDLKLTTNFIYL